MEEKKRVLDGELEGVTGGTQSVYDMKPVSPGSIPVTGPIEIDPDDVALDTGGVFQLKANDFSHSWTLLNPPKSGK